MSALRLQKLLSRAGVASRRQAEELIREGRVMVNGEVASLGDQADPAVDQVQLDGKPVVLPGRHRTYVLNKPRGCLTTRRDPEGRPTVFDLLPASTARGLAAVGRLDFQTEGLLLLTDDGDLAQRVAHPRHGCVKSYAVKVRGVPLEHAVERLRRGIRLRGRPTRPAVVERLAPPRGGRPAEDSSWWTVELSEGRTRQVREMFQAIGHPVQKLRRVAIGPLRDPKLAVGSYRELTAGEVEMLRRASGEGAGRARPRRRPATAARTAGARPPGRPVRGAGRPRATPAAAGRKGRGDRPSGAGRR